MPLWSVQEWRARIGSSYCALGVWRPIKLRGGETLTAGRQVAGSHRKCRRSKRYSLSSVESTCAIVLSWFICCSIMIMSSWKDPVSVSRSTFSLGKRHHLIVSSLRCAMLALSYFKLLLLLCGDIETNPGPDITLKELHEDLTPAASKWFRIGIQLDMEMNKLYKFGQEIGPASTTLLLLEILKYWLNGKTSVIVSWKNVVKVLRTPLVDEKELSDQLRVKHGLLPRSEILRDALKSGYVTLRITKVLVSGSAGNGKTHTKYLLFNDLEKLKEACKSTKLMEVPIRAISREIVGTSHRGWHKVTYDELNEMLARSINEGAITHETITHEETVQTYDSTTREPSQSKHSEEVNVESKNQPIDTADSSESDQQMRVATTPSESHARQKVLELLEQGKELKQILYLHWIHFIDSGGQPQFIDLLPAFVKDTSVLMVVLKLHESLNTCPKIEYYDRQTGESCGMKEVSRLQNDQIVQHCIRTLSTQQHCRIMVVGTHKDAFETPEELAASIDEKNQWLSKNLKRTLGPKLVSYRPPQEILYPINARTPQKEDTDVADEIRQDIESGKDRHPPYKIPVAWFLLEQDMQKLNKSIISLKECYKLALSLHMTKVKVNAALDYLHKLNIILYYPSILQNVIFVSPQVIVDKLTELVAFSFELRAKPESEVDKKWHRYMTYGEIEFKMLRDDRFPKHYDVMPDIFSPKELVKVFVNLLIMAPVTDVPIDDVSSVYFMPSLLPEITVEGLEDYRPKDQFPPALIYFKDGCAPCGTFSRLSVYLISRCGWKHADSLYRNCIKFCLVDEPCEVTIIDAFGWLEVYLNCPSGVAYRICYGVLKNVKSGLEEACRTLGHENISYSNAVMCPKRGQGVCESTPHAATVNDTTQYCICTENPKAYSELHRKQSVWFSQSIPLPGVQFMSQSLMIVSKSDQLQTLEWEKHGLKIHVPPEDSPCEFTVGASFSGNFKLPDKHTLVSPVYYIQPSKKLDKPVTLELEHCCSLKTEDDTKALVPIFAQSSTKEPPYSFAPLSGGKFAVNSNWGTFDVTTFSLFGLSWSLILGPTHIPSPRQPEPTPTLPKKPPVRYFGWIYYRPLGGSIEWFSIKLIVTPQIKECIEEVQRQYAEKGWTFMREFPFCFLENSNTLSVNIDKKGVTTDNGWLIQPCAGREISEENIEEATQGNYNFYVIKPSCDLSAKWNRPPNEAAVPQDNDLNYSVDLKGVAIDSDCSSVLITIHPNSISENSTNLKVTAARGAQETANVKCTLDEDDWADICEYLDKLEINKARRLGGLLGLSPSTVQNKQSVDDIVIAWLRKEDKVSEKSGDPLTWDALVKALQRMKQTGIADKIIQDKKLTHLQHAMA